MDLATHVLLLIVHLVLTVFVAVEAHEDAEVALHGLTSLAATPFPFLFAREDGKEPAVVVEVRSARIGRRMTDQTCAGEAAASVRALVIGLVAGDAVHLAPGRVRTVVR